MKRTMLVTIAAALLLGSSVAVSGQDDGAAPGQEGWVEDDWVVFEGESRYACSGDVCRFTDTMSHPWATGDGEAHIELECSPRTTCSMGGKVTLSNDDGAWQGRWIGFIVEGVTHDFVGWMKGTGDYEGWSYIARYSDADGDQHYEEVRGLLYRGDLPPSVNEVSVSE